MTAPASARESGSGRGRAGSTRYRGRSGQWAFLGHRISGFLVFLFLMLHVVDVSLLRWPATYNQVHRLYGNVLLRLFEVGLLFALVFHTLNGSALAVPRVWAAVVETHRQPDGSVALPDALWPYFRGARSIPPAA